MSILSQQKQSVNTDFPNIRPSLDLRFALAKKLDPRVTFSRGSTGTYFGPDGLMKTASVNEPRFDHDPVTGQSLGLLIEESRQNLLLYSNDFSNATWISSGLLYSYNDTIGLDGTTSASTVTANVRTATFNALYQNFTCAASTTYTFSFYVRLGTLPASSYKIAVYNNTASSFIAVDVVPTQTLSTTSWTRVSYTFTTPAGCVSARVYPYRNNSFTQNNGTFYLWGTQVEAGSLPTSYIPTTASTVTRSADLASMTGTNFSSWYNQSEGTIIATAAPSTNAAYSGWIYLLGTDFNNGISHYRQSDYQPVIRIRSAVRDEYNKVFGAVGFGAIWRDAIARKSAFAFKTNDFNSCVSGVFSNISRATSGTLPTFTGPLTLGSLADGSQKLNGTIARFTYYPIKLTDQQLINLTS